jgi:hypothetical protein
MINHQRETKDGIVTTTYGTLSVVTCDRDIMLRLTNCDYNIRNISVVTRDRDIMLRLTNCDYNIRNISVVTCDRDIMLRLTIVTTTYGSYLWSPVTEILCYG